MPGSLPLAGMVIFLAEICLSRHAASLGGWLRVSARPPAAARQATPPGLEAAELDYASRH